jgi:toxin ParE1/3/4
VIVRWTRRALGDLRRVTDHIAGDNPLAAAEFLSAVQDKVARLQRFPLLGRTGAYQDTRELVVHRHCIVTYRVRADEVQVLQVWHMARDRPRGPAG